MVRLEPLREEDTEQFILDNQEAFRYGTLEEFGQRDSHFEEDGEIISRQTIETAIETGIAYRIINDGEIVGGLVLRVDGTKGELELLFVSPKEHSKGIGYAAWQAVEKQYPQVKVWETMTPYFETRNIHFYVNRLGFHIVEYFYDKHPDPHVPEGMIMTGCFVFKRSYQILRLKIIANVDTQKGTSSRLFLFMVWFC